MTHSERVREEVLAQLGHRGDRPLSLVDQVERGTLSLELAAWLVWQVASGASFLVGAQPGSAGKTTTMRALLDFVPTRLPCRLALPGQIQQLDGEPGCLVTHEISSHRVPGYLWGSDLHAFFRLGAAGHQLAGNLHADTLAETQAQLCADGGVPEDHFRAAHLLVYLRVEGPRADPVRTVATVHHAQGGQPHALVYDALAGGFQAGAQRRPEAEARCADLLAGALADGARTVAQVRQRYLEWEAAA